jgi:pyridoxamine 5'-phosphate oxidase family protein
MSVFTAPELEYLLGADGEGGAPRLARLATVGPDGTPHVVPVGYSYNAELDAIEIGGRNLTGSKKFRDVARQGRAAIVVDDVPSVSPWRARGIEVRGRAEAVAEPRPRIRIHAERIVSWGLEESGTYSRDARAPAAVP